MNRRNIAAVVLGGLMVVGTAGAASAQTTQTPAPDKGTVGGTSGTVKEQAQEKLDREKATLKDRAQDAINVADSNIDALKKLEDNDKGAAQQRDKDMEKKLSDSRDALKKDLDKIDKATTSDWSGVHAQITKDLGTLEQHIKVASNVTHVPSTTGAANKQPEPKGQENKQPENKTPENTPAPTPRNPNPKP